MTIDERLEKLTERHEALTQTVEIIAGMQRDNERLHEKNEVLVRQVVESIDSLARIAHAREQRIWDLEIAASKRRNPVKKLSKHYGRCGRPGLRGLIAVRFPFSSRAQRIRCALLSSRAQRIGCALLPPMI